MHPPAPTAQCIFVSFREKFLLNCNQYGFAKNVILNSAGIRVMKNDDRTSSLVQTSRFFPMKSASLHLRETNFGGVAIRFLNAAQKILFVANKEN